MKKLLLITTIIFICFSVQVHARTEIENLFASHYKFRIIDNSQTERKLRYSINISGHKFNGRGIIVGSQGVYLEEIWLNAPEKYHYDMIGRKMEDNERFTFHNVYLSFEKGLIGQYIDYIEAGVYENIWLLTVKEIILDSQGLNSRGLVYITNEFGINPTWYSQRLNYNLEGGPVEIRNYDYFLRHNGKVIHIIDSQIEEDSIHVRRARVNYTTLDQQELELEIGNFNLDWGHGIDIGRAEHYYAEHYQVRIGNIELDIPGVVPILRSDGIHNRFKLVPSVMEYFKNNERMSNQVKVIGSSQKINLDNPYLLQKRQKGLINGIAFEAGPGNLKDGDVHFDKLALVFPVTGGEGVLNLENVILEEKGFNFEETTIIDPFIKVDKLGFIQVTRVSSKGEEGLIMDGKLIDVKEPISNLLTIYPDALSIKPFLVSGEGIASIDVEITPEVINYNNGLLAFERIRWKQLENGSIEIVLVDAIFITEGERGTQVATFKDTLMMDNDGGLWIEIDDKKVNFEKWAKIYKGV